MKDINKDKQKKDVIFEPMELKNIDSYLSDRRYQQRTFNTVIIKGGDK